MNPHAEPFGGLPATAPGFDDLGEYLDAMLDSGMTRLVFSREEVEAVANRIRTLQNDPVEAENG